MHTNKIAMQRIIALLFFFITLPLYPILFVLIKLSSPGPFIFRQKRIGKDKKIFTMYKFRTMVQNADKIKYKYAKLNEDDGPLFKIRNDPRYTKVGKFLAWSAIDELPQLINIIKGEMAFVGPRPFPVEEANKIPKKYDGRYEVLPGLTAPWVLEGFHKQSFEEWMESDLKYVKEKSVILDIMIILKTIKVLVGGLLNLN